MMRERIPYFRMPGATRLVADFLYSFEKVARFYAYDPWDRSAVLRRVEKLDFPPERRELLVRVLGAQNPESEAVERLRHPNTVAVVTGQQVGFLTGPVYTFYKALTAVRVAEELCGHGIAAVPVFWMATEDHDFEEVAECWVFDERGRGVPIRTGWTDGAGSRPAGELVLPEWPVEALERAVGGLPHGREAVELARGIYRPGRRWSVAFAELLDKVVGQGRLLLFDPLRPEARELLAPVLALAAERAADLVDAVKMRTEELERLGYQAQVRVRPEPALLFVLEDGRRLRAKLRAGRLEYAGGRLERGALDARAKDLSAGALLRPVVQDWVLPTAVSVVGPGEIAYLAQAGALYQVLGVKEPVRRPRVSCTLLDRKGMGVLERYGLSLHDVFGAEVSLRENVGRRLRPRELAAAVEQSQAEVTRALDRIGRALDGWRGPVERAFQKSRTKILYQMGKVERSIAREMVRRDRCAEEKIRWLLGVAYPGRRLQERVFSALAFVAWRGQELVRALEQTIAWDCRDHQLVVI